MICVAAVVVGRQLAEHRLGRAGRVAVRDAKPGVGVRDLVPLDDRDRLDLDARVARRERRREPLGCDVVRRRRPADRLRYAHRSSLPQARLVCAKMSPMDTAAVEPFQTFGQDIPWLLEHWAEAKPDHPALVWAPRDGDGRRWTYAELLTDVRRLAAGLAAAASVARATRSSSTPRTAPRWCCRGSRARPSARSR